MNIALTKQIDMLILLKYLEIIPKNANRSYRFACLFHHSQSGLSASINSKNRVYCWGCGKPYDAIDIYTKKCNVAFQDAIAKLIAFYNSDEYLKLKNQTIESTAAPRAKSNLQANPPITDDKEIIKQKKNILENYSPILDKITNFYHQKLLENQGMLNYLFEKRKLNLDIIKKFKLGFSDLNNNKLFKAFKDKKDILLELDLIRYNDKFDFYYDNLLGCLVIPVLHQNKTMHFYKNNYGEITRFNPKYKALKNFTNTPIFYYPFGFSMSKGYIKERKKIIVHEGFYDVINTHQHNIKNTIGLITIKSYFSTPIIDFFKKYDIKVIIGLDNDESGRQNSQRLKMQLDNENIKNEIKNITKNDCKDADDVLKIYGQELYRKIYL